MLYFILLRNNDLFYLHTTTCSNLQFIILLQTQYVTRQIHGWRMLVLLVEPQPLGAKQKKTLTDVSFRRMVLQNLWYCELSIILVKIIVSFIEGI